ncbi:hypothetical protein OO013_02445 [Mangrovivirga sp. M17]|uniref:Uncharacterized protein n=1 Tax=Mangrovivirga halotolerans TaxID=2993936 RepID=A0ABT3RNH5_9BACT|nr:hypothetical protein [Mangrovivirga halotolerans]MCX2742705.1 hypothetical protein [Mangrovivirga halotolerans]
MKLLFFVISVFFTLGLTNPLNAQNQIDSSSKDAAIEILKNLQPGYFGNAENCIPYKVYAVKYYDSWILSVVQADNLDVFITDGPRTEESVYHVSDFFIQGFVKALENNYVIKHSKRTIINDLEIYDYYELDRDGEIAIKGLLRLELPNTPEWKEPDFFVFKFFHNLFNRAKENAPEAPTIQPALEENMNAMKDTAAPVTDEVK